MTIQFACPHCSNAITAKDEFAGKRARCKKCSAVINVPLKHAAALPEPKAEKISVTCSQCNATLKAPTSYAGQRAKCRNCGNPVEIPRLAQSSPQPAKAATAATPAKPAPKKIQFHCPHCRTKITAGIEYAGRRAKCKSCQSVVQVPALKQPAQQPQAAAQPQQAALAPLQPLQPLGGQAQPGGADALMPLQPLGNDPFASNTAGALDPLAPSGGGDPLTPLTPIDDPFADMTGGGDLGLAPAQGSSNPYASPTALKPRQKSKKASSKGLGGSYAGVASGLNLVYIAIMCSLAGVGVGVVGGMMAASTGSSSVLLAINGIQQLMNLASGILNLVGRIQCLSVPAASGAKPLIIVTVALDVGSIAAVIMAVGSAFLGFALGMIPLIAVPFFGLASMITFLLFIRQIGNHLRYRDLGDRAMQLIVFGVAMLVGVPMAIFVIAMLGVPLLGFLIVIGALVAAIGMLVMYIRLIADARDAAASVR